MLFRSKAAEVLFSDEEQNMIARFLTLKELAEKDLITKEEFLNARATNVGALLPLTNTPPAFGIDRKVPSPDLIIERISILKEAVEARAITPREFSAERDLIIEALLPPQPRQRMRRKIPSKDVMSAAKDLRKLEVLSDLDLITSKEKTKEQQAIESFLGINSATRTPKQNLANQEKSVTLPEKEIIETKIDVVTEIKENPTSEVIKEETIVNVSEPVVSSKIGRAHV